MWDEGSMIHVFQGIRLPVGCLFYDPSDKSDPYGPDDLCYLCSRIHVTHPCNPHDLCDMWIHMIHVMCAL